MRYPYTIVEWDRVFLNLERKSENGFYFFHIRNIFGFSIYIGKESEISAVRIESHKTIDDCYDSEKKLLEKYPRFGYWYA